MARAFGVVAGAGLLAAGYQIAYEEGRQVIHNMRSSSAQRRARNDTVMLTLLATDLPVQAQEGIRRSRDALRAAIALATDPATPEEHRKTLRTALGRLIPTPEGTD
jgi:hypothetical protein